MRAQVSDTAQDHTVSLYWVPGHAGVDGNEISDQAAKAGAMGITGRFDDIKDLKTATRALQVAAAPTPSQGNPGQQRPEDAVNGPGQRCAGCEGVLQQVTAPRQKSRRRPRAIPSAPSHSYNTRSRKSAHRASAPSQNQILTNLHILHSSPRGVVRPGANFPT